LGPKAPDNLIFRVEPIDGRLPSLEDGASWPVILSHYDPVALKDDFLYLRKLDVARSQLDSAILTGSYKLGEVAILPSSGNATFARINIRQSLLGKIVSALYKPTQLKITLNLRNGESKAYRIVSSMIKTDILISPLIENTTEFSLLYSGLTYLEDKKVKSFVIESIGGKKSWISTFEVEFYDFELPRINKLTGQFEPQHISDTFFPADTCGPAGKFLDNIIFAIRTGSPLDNEIQNIRMFLNCKWLAI
jgi:hypothetical protein